VLNKSQGDVKVNVEMETLHDLLEKDKLARDLK
jgi:hypothetical protein